jgi:hypothetical protein
MNQNDKITCSICNTEIDEDAGDTQGYLGMLPVAFCVWCMSSLTDMVIQIHGFDDIDILKEKIADIEQDLYESKQ